MKAAYSRQQFRTLRKATEDAELIQQLIDSKDEDDEMKGDTEAEQKVLQYWKRYNMKLAVDLLVDCWNNVTQATIHHAWRNILEGLPEDRLGSASGEPQSVQAEVEAAVEEARLIPGAGFGETIGEDIQEMIRRAPVTAVDIVEENCME